MQIHRLRLEFYGRRAPTGFLDAADPPDITMGAKRLAAAYGHYYTEGRVPRNTETNSDYFRIGGGSPGRDGWKYELLIEIRGSAVYDVSKYTFKDHFLEAIKAWRDRGWFEAPEFTRLQPVLSIPSKQNSTICDGEAPFRAQLLELSERVSQAMSMITRPLGQSASELRMIFDEGVIWTTDRRSNEWDISEYVRRLRAYESRRAA